jgi:putative membrane protein
MTTPTPKTSDELAVERTRLAAQRTLMAADRSLMAWVRTALSMISFGFTIYKLLQGFQEAGTELSHASSPRVMGMFLTGMGTVAMVLGTLEYWFRLRDLRKENNFRIWRPSFVMALVMSVVGLFLFIAIIAKAL